MNTWLTPIIGLVGVLLGWGLEWLASTRSERRRMARVRHSVRTLLRLECQQNLSTFSEFWRKVTQVGAHLPDIGMLTAVGLSTDELEFDRRQQLIREPLPAWKGLMWKSQVGLVAEALSTSEIDRVYNLYSDLDAFAAMRNEVRKEFDSPEGKSLVAVYSEWMLGKAGMGPTQGVIREERNPSSALRTFNERTRVLWATCEGIYNRAHPYLNGGLLEEDALVPRFRDRPMQRLQRLVITR